MQGRQYQASSLRFRTPTFLLRRLGAARQAAEVERVEGPESGFDTSSVGVDEPDSESSLAGRKRSGPDNPIAAGKDSGFDRSAAGTRRDFDSSTDGTQLGLGMVATGVERRGPGILFVATASADPCYRNRAFAGS